MQTGELDAAVAVYRELIAREPGSAEAFYNLGLALKQKDDFAGAEAALRRAVELDPALPDPPYTLGVLLWQTEPPDEAAPPAATRSARRPDYAEAHYMLGTVLHQQGETDEAMAEFRETIRSSPDLGRGPPEPRPGAAARKRDRRALRPRCAEAERLNQKKADRRPPPSRSTSASGGSTAKDVAGASQRFREAVRLAPRTPQATPARASPCAGERRARHGRGPRQPLRRRRP